MAKVMLMQAAVHDRHQERAQPLGLCRLASVLRRERGDDVRLYDMRLDWRNFQRPLEMFSEYKPDFVGIGGHGVDAPAMYELARRIKKTSPKTPIVVGGVHASQYTEDVASHEEVDFTVVGEGEHTFPELLGALENGKDSKALAGVACREDGRAKINEPRAVEPHLDRFPLPAWDLIDFEAYSRFQRIGLIYKNRRYANVETSRGCSFRCAWCYHSMGTNNAREHSPDYVLEMFDELVNKYDIRDIMIIDDLFNGSSARVTEIFEKIVAKNWNLGISIPIGFRVDMVKDRTIDLMAKAGVYRIMVAIETASPRLQKLMGKNLNLDRTRDVIRRARQQGISVHGNIMLGLPTETESDMRHSVRYARRSHLDTIGLYRAIPFKGTRLYEMARETSLPVADGEEHYSFSEAQLNLSPVPLRTINRISRFSLPYFYLQPGRIFRLLFKIPHPLKQLPYLSWFFVKKMASW